MSHILAKTVLGISLFLPLTAHAARGPATWYVSPHGNDTWSGGLSEPNAAKTDGPWASWERARDEIRKQKAAGSLPGAATVLLRGGSYFLTRPFVLAPEDSGTPDAPVTYAAFPGERPVVSGGRVVHGWHKGEGNLWQVELPEVRAGKCYFHELFVGGQRRPRARIPHEGFLRAAGPAAEYQHDRQANRGNQEIRLGFHFDGADLNPRWRNLDDVNLFLYHSWTNSLHWIERIDEQSHLVRFANPSGWPVCWWERQQRYYVDNVREGLDAPGRWYLDRRTGLLEYYPLPGEDLTRAEVVASVLTQLVKIEGRWEESQPVHDVVFRGLTLAHADWSTGDKRQTVDGQSAQFLAAAVQAEGAQRVSIEKCEIAHVGGYGVWFQSGCKENRIAGCEIHDLGGGGVRLGETVRQRTRSADATVSAAAVPALSFAGTGPRDTGHNRVDNNFIHDGGHVFAAGTGVFLGHTGFNQISHNEICDFNYSGVCVGWVWGFGQSVAHHNRITDNHIHHLGWGVLSDMAGVYTLGPSPGTVVAHNLVHHVNAYSYGGWGLYTDEGSSEIVLENNVVYDTKTGGFHQHYGRDNVIRNNIFAFSREMQIQRSREDLKNSLTLEHNIVYCDNDQVLTRVWKNGDYHVDYNVYWSTAKSEPLFDGRDFPEWRATSGQDQHSLLADPKFVDAAGRDFRLRADSPALRLGFKPIDLAGIGLYGDASWVELPRKVSRPTFELPATAAPAPSGIDDGFEDTPVGSPARGATTRGEESGASIRVADEAAVSGKHSLKFTDAPGLLHSFQPHMYYTLNGRKGLAHGSFDVRLGEGAILNHEWRDAASPYHTGPAVRIDVAGNLFAGRQKLTTVPREAWVHLAITCALGADSRGTYDLAVTLAGGPTQRFANLPLVSPQFHQLRWYGFSSPADAKIVFYVDNVKLSIEKR